VSCDNVKLQDGGMAIVCTRGRSQRRYRCCACTLAGGYQCDWKTGPTKTCDAYICPEHALEVAPGKHICPAHQEAYRVWLTSPAGIQYAKEEEKCLTCKAS